MDCSVGRLEGWILSCGMDRGGSAGRGNGSEVIWICSVSWTVIWKGGAFWGLGGTGVLSSWG